MTTTTDPPAREDGRCARPGCRRKLVFNVRPGLAQLFAREPFCSTECCRDYYGIAHEPPEVAHARKRKQSIYE